MTIAPGQSPLLFLDVVKILNREGIPYVVVGAFAVAFYGPVRSSLDVDAVITVAENRGLEELMDQIKKEGLKVKFNRGDSDDPIQAVLNIEDRYHNRVDLLLGIKGMQESVFQRAVPSQFRGAEINIIGVEDLIAMKMFAGGPQDIQDVVGVLQVSAKIIDVPLLKKLTAHYGKKEFKQLQVFLKKYLV